jgi:colanic acid/amylovoran biosynthesis glycosyltransferase
MRVAYIVSMFPCWSETFILNEMANHQQAGVDLTVFSIKQCNEEMIHDEALPFVGKTVYQSNYIDLKLLLMHLCLILTSPFTYFGILFKLLLLKATQPTVKMKALAVFALSPKFCIAAKKINIEHLHAHFATYPAILAWIVGQFAKIPFTVTAHAHDIYVNQDLLPIICENAAAIVAISEFNKQFILRKAGKQYERKISVIHCGIDLKRFAYDPDKTFNADKNGRLNILSIGRLSGIKGFTYLLEALRLLKDDGIEFNCNIIGDGPLKAKLLQQAASSGITDKVNFLGSKKADEIPAYLKKADVFILACATDKIEGHDGIPVVFMESMAYGVPVIGTRLSGIPELIKHAETGLCAYTEDPVDLMKKIKYLVSHPDEAGQMRLQARKIIEDEFDIAQSCRQLRDLFIQIHNSLFTTETAI